MVDVRHPGALRLLGDDVAGLALGADEQHRAAVRGELPDELHRLVVLLERALEIDDVDLVALAEDVLGHLRVPVAGLVAEVDAGLQHLTHRDGHDQVFLVRVGFQHPGGDIPFGSMESLGDTLNPRGARLQPGAVAAPPMTGKCRTNPS